MFPRALVVQSCPDVADAVSGSLADAEFEFAADEVDNIFIKTVAGDVRALRRDDALERDDSDVSRATTDIEHHRPDRLRHGQLRADGARDRLFENNCFARARVLRRVTDRAALHIGHASRHADNNPRPEESRAAGLCFVNKIGEQLLRHFEVRDDAVR